MLDYRYVSIKSKITGRNHIYRTDNPDRCGHHAFKDNSVAFFFFYNTSGYYCGIVDEFSSIEPNKDPFVQYYLLEVVEVPDRSCAARERIAMARTVRDVVKGAELCPEDKVICDKLKKVAKHCELVKNEDPDCTCPEGQKIISGDEGCCKFITKDGEEVCCPDPWNDQDGKEYCCEDKESCCTSEKSKGFVNSVFNNVKKSLIGKNCKSKGFCCPKGEVDGNESGSTTCCPNGTYYQGVHENREICCPNPYIRVEGKPFCCRDDFIYLKSFGMCVGAVEIDQKAERPEHLKTICSKVKSLPVLIQSRKQNDALKELNLTENAAIGLHIPYRETWGKDNFLWMWHNEKPVFTKWAPGEPDNQAMASSRAMEVFVMISTPNMTWHDIPIYNLPRHVICMFEPYQGIHVS
uniref:C-type lectin domain-containing protein n=1 Tax=Steinernema glaseri TaxID=37863 RepID=A0A1I7Y1Q8_9BILA